MANMYRYIKNTCHVCLFKQKQKKSFSEHVDKLLSLRIPNIFQMFIFHSYFPNFFKNNEHDKRQGTWKIHVMCEFT